jgi:hypothetical protein
MTERLLRLLHCCSSAASWKSIGRSIRLALNSRLSFHVGRCPAGTAGTAVIFFPFKAATLHCGLAGLVSVARQRPLEPLRHLDALSGLVQTVETLPLEAIIESADQSETQWSRSAETIDNLYAATRDLQRQAHFVALLENPNLQAQLQQLHRQLESAIAAEMP